MTCCAMSSADYARDAAERLRTEEWRLAAETPRQGVLRLRLSAPGLVCGGCVAALERAVGALPGIESAKANLTAKTLTAEWREAELDPGAIARAAESAGFALQPLDEDRADAEEARANRRLLTQMAVAGFAAANVMLLSVSVWAGADGATRDLLHWVSALIALPTIAYSGQPFFAGAWRGLRAGRLTMDAPISLAILLAAAVSVSEAIHGGHDAYFDAAVTLIFLLLIGRWLDGAMRAGARSAARRLARLAPRGAWVRTKSGEREFRPAAEIMPGDLVEVAPGDRVIVDAEVVSGRSALDRALLTGETAPTPVAAGKRLDAGALNLDGALVIRATARAQDSTLAEMARLVAAAEERKSRLARLADKAAAIYAPLIHGIAFAVLVGWLWAGLETREATLIGVSLLIITCPCALGLAAPMAQAVASGALFRRGVFLKDGAALERLALAKAAAFDKTGVLTDGRAKVSAAPRLTVGEKARLAALAERSRHPFAQAAARWAGDGLDPQLAASAAEGLETATETPGAGIEGVFAAGEGRERWRLGSWAFCAGDAARNPLEEDDASEVWLAMGDTAPQRIALRDSLRPGAEQLTERLRAQGLAMRVFSGDRPAAVARVADTLGLEGEGGVDPAGKVAGVKAMRQTHGPVLMVGDGLNDAPCMTEADVSMAPAEASDVGRAAADLVFTGRSLTAVSEALSVARRTRAVILQNFALAAIYNCIAIPLAALGYVGPLEAAIAMSSSSLLVTLNALRLARISGAGAATQPQALSAEKQGAAPRKKAAPA